MTSFYSIELYNPLFVLLIGLATFFGFIGFGIALLKFFRVSLPNPWKQVTAVVLGILSASLIIQAISMGGMATKPVLIGFWLVMVLTGCFIFIRDEVWMKKIIVPIPKGWAIIPFGLLLIALITNLFAAVAPSSKIDELYEYMTLPSRIVNDGALRFYLLPWEGAIFPHMLYQMSLTPLHAMGFPDAGNIVSWGLITLLVWFGWRVAIVQAELSGWSFVILACLVTGIYPVIWNVTGGSYSMGDLATAIALVALLSHKELIAKTGMNNFALIISLLVLGSVSSKVTLLPLGLATILLMLFYVGRSGAFSKRKWLMVIFYTIVPWIILYLPILTWTFRQSGSPYGPLFAGFLNTHSVYDLEIIRNIQHVNRQVNLPSPQIILESLLIYFPAIFWIGVILFFADRNVPSSLRLAGLLLLVMQTFILVFIVIFDPRYYGGLLHGVLITWMIHEERSGWKLPERFRKLVVAGSVACLVPWLGLQIFYSSQFFPVALGFQDKMEFYHQKIAFTKDYLLLDKLLPRDAVFVFMGEDQVRLDINFAPRPVYLSMDHPAPDKKVYLFCINCAKATHLKDYRIDSLVYTNDKAIITTYRNPFRPSILGRLEVYSLVKSSFPIKIK